MIMHKKGNIFDTECQTIVNTVNTDGVMGAGIALEFKIRFPDMFEEYLELCKQEIIKIGYMQLYTIPINPIGKYEKILNFPTKTTWRLPSKHSYLEIGLKALSKQYKALRITSIAFPLLGANNGKIGSEDSIRIMEEHLIDFDIPIEIWTLDPKAKDKVFEAFRNRMLSLDNNVLKDMLKLSDKVINTLKVHLHRDDVNSFSILSRIKGLNNKIITQAYYNLDSL